MEGCLVGLPFLFVGLFFLFILASTAFWVWMLIDCATNEPEAGNDKVVWILVIVLAQAIGAAIYFFARRPERIRKFGR